MVAHGQADSVEIKFTFFATLKVFMSSNLIIVFRPVLGIFPRMRKWGASSENQSFASMN